MKRSRSVNRLTATGWLALMAFACGEESLVGPEPDVLPPASADAGTQASADVGAQENGFLVIDSNTKLTEDHVAGTAEASLGSQ